ncbi:MAG: hypothetical protein RIC95_03435 [Vicingaceae bacterium]
MLIVSVFTFFGLAGIQNVSYFSSLFGEEKMCYNLSAQEEENETSNNEVKEVKESFEKQSNFPSLEKCNSSHTLAFRHHYRKLDNGYLEVATPPPESIG